MNWLCKGSNNTNKFSPQELTGCDTLRECVQIIQINSVLKNAPRTTDSGPSVQIIQINSVLKNQLLVFCLDLLFK